MMGVQEHNVLVWNRKFSGILILQNPVKLLFVISNL